MYILIKLFCFIYSFCFFLNLHNGHFALAGSSEDENFEIHECVSKLKEKILGHKILFSENIPEFNSASIQVNEELKNNSKIENEIYVVSYNKFDEPTSLQYSFDLFNNNKNEAITIEYGISISTENEKKEPMIELKLNSYLFNNKKIMKNAMEQKFQIDQTSVCNIIPTSIELVKIIELGQSNKAQIHYLDYNFDSKEINYNEKNEEFDLNIFEIGKLDQLIKKIFEGGQSSGEILFFIKSFRKVVRVKWDKNINEIVLSSPHTKDSILFTKYDMKIFSLGKYAFNFDLYCSKHSSLFFKEGRCFSDSGELTSISREFSHEIWQSVDLNPPIIHLEEDKPKIIGFEYKDFQKSDLVYNIVSPRQLKPYQGSSIYGTWRELVNSNAREFNYQFTNSQKCLHTQPLCHDDVQSYLTETIYYDYSDENVKKIISQIKASIELEKINQTSQRRNIEDFDLTLQMISKKVKEIITFDHDAIENKMIKASEILLNRKGVCKQFSTLFVTLARALNIPARVVGGWLVDEKFFGGHIWVEILKNKKWIPIEPQRIITYKNITTHFKRNYVPRYSVEVNNENDTSEDTAALRLDELINGTSKGVVLKKGLFNID